MIFGECMTGIKKLKTLREKINSIDKQLLNLLSERANVSAEVGEIKKNLNIEIIDRVRESEILLELKKKCTEQQLDFEYIKDIWNVILNKSHDIQINGK
jgi:chorismate mutase